MAREVTFISEDVECSALLFVPGDLLLGERRPAVVMAPGFARVKDDPVLMALAGRFSEAGLIAMVIDYRNFGKSGGEPRQFADPAGQVEDYRNAITWVSQLPEVDPVRIGVWGGSFSGGHVLKVGAYDRRVKAVVSQAPMVNGWESTRANSRSDQFRNLQEMLIQERIRRYNERTIKYVKIIAAEGEPSLTQDAESRAFSARMAETCPTWRNEMALHSLERFLEYDPGASIHLISPTPLMMIIPLQDHLSQTDFMLAAYQRALEPKALTTIEGGHFAVHVEPGFSQAARAASEWFQRHLMR
ncbi:MAG: alpha/beta fold hydrolase [Chloroflexi bacterium]|nr:alpha/beta fold hydrolase [Chloroflexota bacterium]